MLCGLPPPLPSPTFKPTSVVSPRASYWSPPTPTASKHSAKEYHLTIALTDERFERWLSHCVTEVAMRRCIDEEARYSSKVVVDDPPRVDAKCLASSPCNGNSNAPLTSGVSSSSSALPCALVAEDGSSSASAATSVAACTDVAAEVAQHGTDITIASPGRSSSAAAVGTASFWSRFRAWWHDESANDRPNDVGVDHSGGVVGGGGAQMVLVIGTPFEADAWCAAIREAQSALVCAARAQRWALVQALAVTGRDVNVPEAGNQRTALHYAAGYGETATARVLVQLGAQVNARDGAGMTPLGWVCLKGHVELTQLLLKSNADPLIKAHSGVLVNKTAIALARLYGSKSGQAAWRAQELVHHLLMHSGAGWFKVHHILGQGGFGKVRRVIRVITG